MVQRNIKELFTLMQTRDFRINQILNETTSKFSSDSSIIEFFNKDLAQYDMFGVNPNADVRYQNTRMEMLLALDEIVDRWNVEKRNRDEWINKNKAKFIHSYERELQIQWARTTKSSLGANLAESLETRIDNFIQMDCEMTHRHVPQRQQYNHALADIPLQADVQAIRAHLQEDDCSHLETLRNP